MAFAKKQEPPRISADRLASLAGGRAAMAAEAAAPAESAPRFRGEIQPDLSRIRPRGAAIETPEERKRRLAAKTVNFTMTFIARIAIMAAVGYLLYEGWQGTGAIHRGYAFGMFAMFADFGRVILKAMEPGTK
ncbi:hypothetical protein [Hyphococcus sp.]|jgi:hypothetical protein|uniref:hypothetical protein n=1 Tax=Hyphococcus sp. TaxID=2038636 RepID=UPI003D0D9370